MTEIVRVVLLVGTLAGLSWTAILGVPMLARVAAVAAVGRLRDELADAVLDGRLPRADPAVQTFLAVTDCFVSHPEHFGLSEAMAAHIAYERLGIPPRRLPTYAALNVDQRRLMHDAERVLAHRLRAYLVFGSRFWLLLLVAAAIDSAASRVLPARATSPKQLATDLRLTASKTALERKPDDAGDRRLAGAI
jgi:hypothetical protein